MHVTDATHFDGVLEDPKTSRPAREMAMFLKTVIAFGRDLRRGERRFSADGIRGRESFTTGKPSIRPACAYTQASRSVSHVAPSSRSHPFDTALRAYSGQAVDLQEATGEAALRCTQTGLAAAVPNTI